MNYFLMGFFFTGGGRDLATAVTFAKQNALNNSLIDNSQSNSAVTNVTTTFDTTANANAIGVANQQQPQPVLKHLIPAQSILKPFLPKVNTASTRVHPPSTTTNITAAVNAAMSYSNAGSFATKTQTASPGKN